MKKLLAAAAALSLVGCAFAQSNKDQEVRFDTRTESGTVITGAECMIRSSLTVPSGDAIMIRRSSSDLTVVCIQEGQPPAYGRLVSRVNAAMAGDIAIGVLGGVLGGAVGNLLVHGTVIHNPRTTGYSYPAWVQLVFGQTLVFDRAQETDGVPVTGVAADEYRAKTPRVTNATSTACAYGAAPCP